MKTLKYAIIVALAFCGQLAIAAKDVSVEGIKKRVKTSTIAQLQRDRHDLKNEKSSLYRKIHQIDALLIEIGDQICTLRSKEMGKLKEELATHETAYNEDVTDIQKTKAQRLDVEPAPVPVEPTMRKK